MSVSTGPRRGLMINALTGDNFDAAFRTFLRAIDALLCGSVLNLTTSTPPGSPANGDAYIVAPTGTGAWSGHDNAIAVWTTDNPSAGSGEWEFYPAARGMIVCNIADSSLYFWNNTAWAAVGGGGSSLAIKINGTLATVQSILNLKPGANTNVVIADDGVGGASFEVKKSSFINTVIKGDGSAGVLEPSAMTDDGSTVLIESNFIKFQPFIDVEFVITPSSTASVGGGAAVPATVLGFLPVVVNGVACKIPFFAP